VKFAEEIKEGFEGLKLREEKDRIELARKEADKRRRQNMTLEERILDEDDPAKRKELLEIMRAARNPNMTPEQILAESAAYSQTAVDALIRLADKSKENAERVLSELKKVYADANDRQDKNLKTMLEPVIEAAKRQAAQPQTIVH